MPQCNTNEVIVQIRAQKAAVDRAIPSGGDLEREEDPTADPQRLFGEPGYLLRVITANLPAFPGGLGNRLATLPGVQRLRPSS